MDHVQYYLSISFAPEKLFWKQWSQGMILSCISLLSKNWTPDSKQVSASKGIKPTPRCVVRVCVSRGGAEEESENLKQVVVFLMNCLDNEQERVIFLFNKEMEIIFPTARYKII